MKSIAFTFIFLQLIIPSFVYSQKIEKKKGKVNDESLTYFVMKPESEVIGVLMLLPGSGEKPKDVFKKTNLPQKMVEKGFLTVIPKLHNSLFADQKTINNLNEICHVLNQEYEISKLVIGGFSSGGAVGIGYAQYLLSNDPENILKGVFAIDPPLDLERVYTSSLRKIDYECQGLIQKEGYSIKEQLENALGGSHYSNPDQYLKYSAFSANENDGGNAKYLNSIPIRLYTEPDLNFVRTTYCNDLQYSDINAVDLQRLYEFLLGIGNRNAEYITTVDKGFHSWNILNTSDCAEWIIRIIN